MASSAVAGACSSSGPSGDGEAGGSAPIGAGGAPVAASGGTGASPVAGTGATSSGQGFGGSAGMAGSAQSAAGGSTTAGSTSAAGGSTAGGVPLGGASGSSGAGGAGHAGAGGSQAAGSGGLAAGSGGQSAGSGGRAVDVGTDGDGDFEIGPNYTSQPDLGDKGNPQGKSFSFTMPLAASKLFDGKDPTLSASKPVNPNRSINVYVPARYEDGTPAPVLIIQDGPGPLNQVARALDNLTISTDPKRRLPAFVVVAVANGGSDAIGSERGLEYDTMSDRYARFIDTEVLPAVVADTSVKAAYPRLRFTTDPSGRAALGCSSGGAAAFTMAWFRPDLFSRVIAYSTTLVAQQNPVAPEAAMYPDGAWEYHSGKQLIQNDADGREKQLRIFINVNENDLGATAAESGKHNWVLANRRTAAALAAKGFHYKFIEGLGQGHCAGSVQSASLADVLIWVWRGYEASGS